MCRQHSEGWDRTKLAEENICHLKVDQGACAHKKTKKKNQPCGAPSEGKLFCANLNLLKPWMIALLFACKAYPPPYLRVRTHMHAFFFSANRKIWECVVTPSCLPFSPPAVAKAGTDLQRPKHEPGMYVMLWQVDQGLAGCGPHCCLRVKVFQLLQQMNRVYVSVYALENCVPLLKVWICLA